MGFGLLGDGAVYRRSLGININAWWGLVMLAFGTVMLFLGRGTAVRSTNKGDEALGIEERERREGFERDRARGDH